VKLVQLDHKVLLALLALPVQQAVKVLQVLQDLLVQV
jgi:hypothetical protein